jgi:aspartate/methionine/tyrosine aminotransferase
MSGLSKVCGLPQMKLGWIVVNGPDPLRVDATNRLELIADTFLSVGAPVQHALPTLLSIRETMQEQIGTRTRANLLWLRERLGSSSACEVLALEGGWYATLKVPRIRSEEEWVLVQPGFFYDFEEEAFLVLSLLTPEETFRRGVEAVLDTSVQSKE